MQTVIILIHLMIVLAMVGLVLLQKSEGGGLGMGGGGGGGGGFLSSRGTANVLTRATAILAALFFATSLVLSIIAGMDRKPRSILDGSTTPGPAAPTAPGAPLGGPGGGVLDRLQGPPPAAPAGPQAPRSQ
jgi:preprotein translocase subunit SecG